MSFRAEDPFRPRYHFAPARNWMNDPNGLIYLDGEYHLFFQHNPEGTEWGNIGWGHAVSEDLLNWRELSMALPQQDFMIFSGSAVLDQRNASGVGFGANGAPPVLAFYTAHYPAGVRTDSCLQRQHMAFSQDGASTWTHLETNPVLDLALPDFRDPKVFWHAPSEHWIMVVAFAAARQVGIFRSKNLRHWTETSRFGPVGEHAGQWECPELFEVPMDGGGAGRWILKVDVDRNVNGPISGGQYFVGSFDGEAFRLDPGSGHGLVDFGPDFYASQAFSHLPSSSKGPVWLGWCSNHYLGARYPTGRWQGCMSLPRELFLYEGPQGMRLGQRPVEQWDELVLDESAFGECTVDPSRSRLLDRVPAEGCYDVRFQVDARRGRCGLRLVGLEGAIFVGLDADEPVVVVDLSESGAELPSEYHRVHRTGSIGRRATSLRVVWDATTLEVFVNGGRMVLTCRVFLTGQLALRLEATDGATFYDVVLRRPKEG